MVPERELRFEAHADAEEHHFFCRARNGSELSEEQIVVLAPTRHKLRRAIKIINETFSALGLEKHPDKTFIGRVAKGFDFLGYHITPEGLSVAPQTLARFIDRAHRLYEQERGKPEGFPRLGAYARRWRGWERGGLPAFETAPPR